MRNQTESEYFSFISNNIHIYVDSSECAFNSAGISTNMQFSYRRLTALYIYVAISKSQLFQDNSEVGGEVLQSFRLGSPQIEPAGSISPERAQVDTFSSLSSSADLSQPPSNPELPVPVNPAFAQGAVVDGLGASAFDFAGPNSPGYLAQEPEQSISQSHQAQADPLESGRD